MSARSVSGSVGGRPEPSTAGKGPAAGVETTVEVGLAYGSSALAIGEALGSVGARRPLHVVIDPLQATE